MTERDSRGIPVVAVAGGAVVLLRIGRQYLRFLVRRKRSVRAFRTALKAAEMPRERIEQLTQAYHDAGSLRKMLAGRAAR